MLYPGATFGKLTVLKISRTDNSYRKIYLCSCSCGGSCDVREDHLSRGKTTSCGCRQGGLIHGNSRRDYRSPEYRSWASMIQRCTNPNVKEYPLYGGRGVSIHPNWYEFPKFLSDLGPRPEGTSLDRFPDKNGDYEPGNCRWATPRQQSNNTRSNKVLTYKGRTQTASEWGRELGINIPTLLHRLSRGWPVEKALSTITEEKS